MKNNTVKKIQMGGWSKRAYKYIRSKVNHFDDEGVDTSFKKKPKNKCRSKAHNYVLEQKPLGIRNLTWDFYKCSKCGKFKFKNIIM